MRRHARSVAQHVGMAVPHVGHTIRSCRSVSSTVRHNAKLTVDSLSHAGNAEAESAAARNKPSWRPSVRRHARPVAQHVGMAVWRLDHVTNSGRSAGSTVRHNAKLSQATLSHTGNPEAE